MDNSAVPRWWARHINNGEQSNISFSPKVTVDAGVTKFDRQASAQTKTIETDILSGVKTNERQTITQRGITVGVIESVSADWGRATPQQTPITTTVTIENRGREPLTISNVHYTTTLNNITVGNGTAPESYTVQPGQTRTVEFTFTIDSQMMDEWWVSHVRHGERTKVNFDATARVSSASVAFDKRVQFVSDNPTTISTEVVDEE